MRFTQKNNRGTGQVKKIIRTTQASEVVAMIESSSYLAGEKRVEVDFSTCAENSKLYLPDSYDELSVAQNSYTTEYEVRDEFTLAGARRLKETGEYDRIAVLNFASAVNPGGGFLHGANAQEESLARSSGLYHSLCKFKEDFYGFHKNQKSPAYSDRIIYTPDCPVIRDEMHGFLLTEPYYVDFITSPAPYVSIIRQMFPEEYKKIPAVLHSRISKMLHLARHKNVDALVLGAWGCGVFGNDPVMISNLFSTELKCLEGQFKKILFSIPKNATENNAYLESVNFDTFKKTIEGQSK